MRAFRTLEMLNRSFSSYASMLARYVLNPVESFFVSAFWAELSDFGEAGSIFFNDIDVADSLVLWAPLCTRDLTLGRDESAASWALQSFCCLFHVGAAVVAELHSQSRARCA